MPMKKGDDKGNGEKIRDSKYSPNTQENKQVLDAMKKAGIPITPENKQTIHRALSSEDIQDFNELVKFIKDLFNK